MRLFLLLSLLLPVDAHSAVERTTARTSYGADIAVQVNVPGSLNGPAAAVVLAPGQGYHMDLPLMAELAAELESKGIIAFRFNWDYFTKGGQPSPDLKKEAIDMQAVVALAKADPRVDAAKLIVAGKSLGSIISYYVFTHDESLRALALLTPVCTSSYDENDQPLPKPVPGGEANYPRLGDVQRPVLFATSSADPLCQTTHLLELLAPHGGRFPFTVVGGNHSWDFGEDQQERNRANRAVGIGFVSSWLNQLR